MKQTIRKLLGTEKLIIGTDRTLKALRKGELEQVILASNCAADTLSAIERDAGLTGAEIVRLTENNDELGVLCKKPFRVAVLGVRKK